MNHRLLPILIPALAALALIVALVLRGGGGEDAPASDAPRDREVAAETGVDDRTGRAAPAPAPQSPGGGGRDSRIELLPTPGDPASFSPTPAATPTPTPEALGPPTLALTVLEEGTGTPLAGATVRLARQQGSRPPDRLTDGLGVALFDAIQPGMYIVTIEHARGPAHMAGRIVVQDAGAQDATFQYPRRLSFLMQLVDETGRAVPNMPLEFAAAGGPSPAWEAVTSDSEGLFELKGHAETARWLFRAEADVMFSAGEDRRWGNPYEWSRRFDAEGDGDVLVMQRDLVEATAVLVNAPPLETSEGRLQAILLGGQVTGGAIPIESSQFTFRAPPGVEVQVRIGRSRDEWAGRTHGSEVEKIERVQMPEVAGPFRFEIEFADRLEVTGRVVAGNAGVAGVLVAAHSKPSGYQISAAETNSAGAFTLSLPPDRDWTFEPDLKSLPDGHKGFTPETKTWSELESSPQVLLRLEASSVVWGEVVLPGGRPAPRVNVSIRGEGAAWRTHTLSAMTDNEGVFRLDVPPLALESAASESSPTWAFALSPELGVGFATAKVDDASTPVRIELVPYVKAQLTVTGGGVPLDSVRVTSSYNIPWDSRAFNFGSGGFRPLGAGVYEIDRALPGIGTLAVTGTVNGQQRTLTVPVPAGAPNPVALRADF